jgi:hypothetical protein
VSGKLTVWFGDGIEVEVATWTKLLPGHGEADVL